jgi:hypothetical protein
MSSIVHSVFRDVQTGSGRRVLVMRQAGVPGEAAEGTELHGRRKSAHGRSQMNGDDPRQDMRKKRRRRKERGPAGGEFYVLSVLFGGFVRITFQDRGVISKREPPVRAGRHPGSRVLAISQGPGFWGRCCNGQHGFQLPVFEKQFF